MITIKKLSIIVTTLFVLTACSEEEQTLRIGTEGAWPPFNHINDNGELVGFDIDIANALCEQMQRQCTFVQQNWDGIIPALNNNEYDAIIASMSITEKRKKRVTFSEKYYQTPARFIAQKDSSFTGVDFTEDTAIGVLRGSTHHDFIKNQYPTVDLKLYATIEGALMDLMNGRLNAVFGDSIVLSETLLKKPAGVNFEYRGKNYTEPKYFGDGIGIAVRKDEQELADAFSKAIKAIRENGKYQEISNKYFGFDIY